MINIHNEVPIIGIYKILSPTGKIYIGQSINIDKRKKWYENMYCVLQPKIYKSINKHGWDKHQHEIIEECNLEQLNEREVYWKQYYIDQHGWGKMLFCKTHDNGGGPHSPEMIKNMSKPRNNTENMKKPRTNTTNFKGPKSEQHKLNMRKPKSTTVNMKGPNINYIYPTKPIIQYSLDKEFIREWPSVKLAKLELKLYNINEVLSGRLKSVGGYIFIYKSIL